MNNVRMMRATVQPHLDGPAALIIDGGGSSGWVEWLVVFSVISHIHRPFTSVIVFE